MAVPSNRRRITWWTAQFPRGPKPGATSCLINGGVVSLGWRTTRGHTMLGAIGSTALLLTSDRSSVCCLIYRVQKPKVVCLLAPSQRSNMVWPRVLPFGPGCYRLAPGATVWPRVLPFGPGCYRSSEPCNDECRISGADAPTVDSPWLALRQPGVKRSKYR
jgi:hypothetical protein